MLEPLSKRALLPSSSILTQGYVFRPTPMHEWVWAQEGGFPRHFYALGALPRVASLIATNFWEDWPPFFAIPSFKFNLPSLWFSPVPLGSLSPGDLGCNTQSNCSSFSDITLLHWQTVQCSLVTGLHCQPPLLFPHLPQQRTWPPSPHWVLGLSLPQFHDLPPLQIGLWRCGYPSTSWMEIDFLVSENKLHLNSQQ